MGSFKFLNFDMEDTAMILGKITKNDIGNIRNKAKRGWTLEDMCSLYGYGSDTAKFEDDLNNVFKFEVNKKGNSSGNQILKKLHSNSDMKKRSEENRAKKNKKNDVIDFEALPDEGSAVYNPDTTNERNAFEETDFDSKIDVTKKSENKNASEESDIKAKKSESGQQETEVTMSKPKETKADTERLESKQQVTDVKNAEHKQSEPDIKNSASGMIQKQAKKNFTDEEILDKLKEEKAKKTEEEQALEEQKKKIESALIEFENQISNSKDILNKLKAEYEKLKVLIPKFNAAKKEMDSINRGIADIKIEILDIEKAIQLVNPVKLVFSGSLPDGDYIDATTINEASDEEINQLIVRMLSDSTMYNIIESRTIQVLRSFAVIMAKVNKVRGEKKVNLYFEDDKSEVIQLVKQLGELQKSSIKVIIEK